MDTYYFITYFNVVLVGSKEKRLFVIEFIAFIHYIIC